ncbi:hypothetical protein PUMCH_001965 [Australozyma saopauloensis]|uniref:Extracellular membrane protein CFEM domain-containing protein n=1 Tax=Australozyma saopauloensis TaxID=291208 RepID=A0AAX4H878_9ASCO|nr:hypothetical protein PUMCH_001965 [[Candida] saopauloensis]
MHLIVVALLIIHLSLATPPACFLGCINVIAHICPRQRSDLECLCRHSRIAMDCIANLCWGVSYYSSQDHFRGTCMEHGFDFGEMKSFHHFVNVQPANSDNDELREDWPSGNLKTPNIEEVIYDTDYDSDFDQFEAQDEYSTDEDDKFAPEIFRQHKPHYATSENLSWEAFDQFDAEALEEHLLDLPIESLTEVYQAAPDYCHDVRGYSDNSADCLNTWQYSKTLPVSSKYLERFYIPYSHFADMRRGTESHTKTMSKAADGTNSKQVNSEPLMQIIRTVEARPLTRPTSYW